MSRSNAQKKTDTPARARASAPLRRSSSSSSSRNNAAQLTSQRIAADLAAFKKSGGRIEVLGNTPIRPYVSRTSSRKTTTAAKAAKTARATKAAKS
ncbi:MAG: hypothetical protein GX856_06095 [Gammaproteobacteria bacterium]|jgi:hypothetical protein|nr:hypothetical protein [Gammaproteobacteria bacterium]